MFYYYPENFRMVTHSMITHWLVKHVTFPSGKKSVISDNLLISSLVYDLFHVLIVRNYNLVMITISDVD